LDRSEFEKSELHVELRKLSSSERREIERLERHHRSRLSRLGWATRVLVDESGCFGVVLVEDLESERKGLLLPDGNVRWMDEAMGPGAFADATVSGVTIEGSFYERSHMAIAPKDKPRN
jgi:hypothetical protein